MDIEAICPTGPDAPALVKITAVARFLGVSTPTVRRMAAQGVLPELVRLGTRDYYFPREALRAALEKLATGGNGKKGSERRA